MERIIKMIAKSQAFSPNDKLSQMVNKYDNDELIEESLDLVYAASKAENNYSVFLKFLNEIDGIQ